MNGKNKNYYKMKYFIFEKNKKKFKKKYIIFNNYIQFSIYIQVPIYLIGGKRIFLKVL